MYQSINAWYMSNFVLKTLILKNFIFRNTNPNGTGDWFFDRFLIIAYNFYDYIYIPVLINPMNINDIKWLVICDVITHHIPSSTRIFKTFFLKIKVLSKDYGATN